MSFEKPAVTPEEILRWADAYRERTGRWPGQARGTPAGEPGPCEPPELTEEQVLARADAHRLRTGGWPAPGPGPAESE